MTGRNIICFSSIDWDFLWQGHQELMSRLAASGNRVLFIENIGIRTPNLRDLPRLRHRLKNWRRGIQGFRQERENLYVYSPLVLPFPYARWACWMNRWWLLSTLRRWMRAVNFHRPIVWSYLPTPLVRNIVEGLDDPFLIYYCADRLTASSARARRLLNAEERFFKAADLVFVTSHALQEYCCQFHSDVHLFPSGVSLERFQPDAAISDPADVASLPRPRIGYIGGIHQWVDQQLVHGLAQASPAHSIVLVGPVQTDVSLLQSAGNVHLLGAKPPAELPGYLQAFDVCIIPYVMSEYTHYVFPAKLNEYLAMGKPVVSTRLPELVHFNVEFDAPIRLAGTREEFNRSIEDALQHDANGRGRQHRLSVAARNDWQSRLNAMSALIEDAAQRKQLAQDADWRRTFRVLLRGVWRRMLRVAGVGLVSWLLLFHTPLVWWIGAPLRVAQPPQQADVIVVFGSGVGESGIAGQGYEERVQHAVDLWKAGFAPRLLLQSGSVYAMQETQVMAALAASLGVPKEALQADDRPRSTYEMVRFTAERLHRNGQASLLLVSSPYHMRRVSLVFRKQASDVRVAYAPIPRSVFYDAAPGISLRHYRGILHEYLAIVFYWWRGYL